MLDHGDEMNNIYEVVVLMSTYNGERYIEEQLKSILNQECIKIKLIVRDDGSTDRTVEILEHYQSMNPELTVYKGNNIGVKRSFEKLLCSAPKAEYYALADQDDIWFSNKLISGVRVVEDASVHSKPMLYFCNQNCVNQDGEFLYKRFGDHMIQPTIFHTVLQNEYSGCTFVFNKYLLKQVQKVYSVADKPICIMHDVLILLVAQLIGTTFYDANVHMAFRRHGNNVTEAKLYSIMNPKEKFLLLWKRWRTLTHIKATGGVTQVCEVLLRCFYSEMKSRDYIFMKEFCEYKSTFLKWIKFLVRNPIKEFFPKPRYRIYLKIFFRIY